MKNELQKEINGIREIVCHNPGAIHPTVQHALNETAGRMDELVNGLPDEAPAVETEVFVQEPADVPASTPAPKTKVKGRKGGDPTKQ